MKATHPALAVLNNPKVIKYGAIAIGGIIIFFIARKQIKKIFDRPYGERAQERELRDVTFKEYNLTISEGESILITQNLFNAMNRTGVDTDSIIRNLESLRTKDDLLLIIRQFGIKPYNGSGMTVTEIRKKLWSRDLNLNGWLAAELSGWFYSKTRKQVIAIYEKLGVNF